MQADFQRTTSLDVNVGPLRQETALALFRQLRDEKRIDWRVELQYGPGRPCFLVRNAGRETEALLLGASVEFEAECRALAQEAARTALVLNHLGVWPREGEAR